MKPKRIRREVNGVLLLDKPLGMTSNAALQKARWLYNAAKAGHTGTLDPMATGLLPLCFGEATKFSGLMLDADKSYEAVIKLGVVTTTADAEGEVVLERPVNVVREQLDAILPQFRGAIEQVPPMYSALKFQGKALYEYAREGIEIERKARQVTIYRLDVLEFDGAHIRIAVDCSKGTYIRTLGADIGEALGCGGHLIELRRTRIGPFDLSQTVTVEALELQELAQRDEALWPVDALVNHFPRVQLDTAAEQAFMQGQAVMCPVAEREIFAGLIVPEDEFFVRIYAAEVFLGLAKFTPQGKLQPHRLICRDKS